MRVEVVVMCKAPVAGSVKTRLLGRYSADEAAELYASMATTVIERAKRLFDRVTIAADKPGHSFFSRFGLSVVAQGGGDVVAQGGGDLGARMQRQVVRVLAESADAIVVIGSDSPHMEDERLLEAAALIYEYDVVIGPVDDGGYDLIAMRMPHPLFTNVAWSTPSVLEQTTSKIKQLGLSMRLLKTGFDVDFPEDVERARSSGWKPFLSLPQG